MDNLFPSFQFQNFRFSNLNIIPLNNPISNLYFIHYLNIFLHSYLKMILLNYFTHTICIEFIRFQLFSSVNILSTILEMYYIVCFAILEDILCHTISILILNSLNNHQFVFKHFSLPIILYTFIFCFLHIC